ncbi:primosomal protein N' [Glaciecola sp. MF2-115]|uniref:primosomal protein N' n=1 Tax=Glaciecola sp. MF2-115 TaxID=3384827 RepID=UPI0039A1B173
MQVIQVAISVPMPQLFDYKIDMLDVSNAAVADSGDDALIGCRVLVPFGPRKCVGIVLRVGVESEYEITKIKSVLEVLDSSPVCSEQMLQLGKWMSEYYHYPIGEVLHTLLPAALRKQQSGKTKPSVATESYLQLTPASSAHEEVDELLARSAKQFDLYRMLEKGPLRVSIIKQQFTPAIIKALTEKNLIEKIELVEKVNDWKAELSIAEKPVPNVEQAMAISTINLANSFDTMLIEGVTGSGKTEVYLQIIEPLLAAGKQVLILVPEIGLTPQTVGRFEKRFGIRVGTLHSNLNDTERLQVWQQAKEGRLGIIIGTRSSIFTEMKNPGMIIVDEEHDESFKQQDNLKYHARDIAVYRARQLNIPLVLGSATPSLESLHNALEKKYRHILLPNRAGSAAMPAQRLMNIKGQPMQYGIAQGMIDKMQVQLNAGNQVMVFVNRRGYAPALLCHQCGHVENCERCDNPMTVHKSANNLQCHRCADIRHLPKNCPACGHDELDTFGIGTEQLQQGLESLFPDFSTVRVDSDTVRGKGKLSKLLKDINQKKYQILVGTQILSKGHHFPDVTLVLILNVDSALFSADFRAPEKLAQLITQLSGRAGRSDKVGEMWLQTHCPEHPLLQDLINNGFSDFARYALLERKHACLPPHEHQICIRSESHHKHLSVHFLQLCAQLFTQFKYIKVLGPFPAFIEKRQGRYRNLLIIQSASRKYLQQATEQANKALSEMPVSKQVRWSIDVSPIDFS